MKLKLFKKFSIVLAIIGLTLIVSPFSVYARQVIDERTQYTGTGTGSGTTSASDCAGLPASVQEANGCNAGSEDKLPNLITNILNAVIGIVGFVAVVFVIIGGINYMTSAGNSEKTKKHKKCFRVVSMFLQFSGLRKEPTRA